MIICRAESEDIAAIHKLIIELAQFEKASNEVITTSDNLHQALEEMPNWVFAWVCEDNNEIIGAAICYLRYSTWKGTTLYLEDLIVTHNKRGGGTGTKLLNEVIRFAKQENYTRVSWQVLDWNTNAIEFYKKYPIVRDNEWINIHLDLI